MHYAYKLNIKVRKLRFWHMILSNSLDNQTNFTFSTHI